jgi:hypothetical protein
MKLFGGVRLFCECAHPSVSISLSLVFAFPAMKSLQSLDWLYHPNVETYTVNDYERLSAPMRRTDRDLIIPRLEREDRLLYEWNVSAKDVAQAVATVVRIKNQRHSTAHFVTSGWQTVDALWHRTTLPLSQRAWERSTLEALTLERQHLAYLVQQQQQASSSSTDGGGPKLNPKDEAFDYASYYLHLYPDLYDGSSTDLGMSDPPPQPRSVDGDQASERWTGPLRRHSHAAGPPPPPNAQVGPIKPSVRTSSSPTNTTGTITTSTKTSSGRRHSMGTSTCTPDRFGDKSWSPA